MKLNIKVVVHMKLKMKLNIEVVIQMKLKTKRCVDILQSQNERHKKNCLEIE